MFLPSTTNIPKMCVLLFLCLILGVVSNVEKVSDKKVQEFRKPHPEAVNLTDIEVIMERQRQLETIRLTEYLTLKAIEDTKFRSEELTAILDKRLHTVRKLLKRLPFIVGYFVNRDEPVVNLELPAMSRMFLMTSLGRGEKTGSELPAFFESYFKTMNASRSATEIRNLKECALKEIGRLSLKIGNNYLGRTMDRVDSSVAFMQSALTQTRDMLKKLPELVFDVMDGPYDTVTEDRILEGYQEHVKE